MKNIRIQSAVELLCFITKNQISTIFTGSIILIDNISTILFQQDYVKAWLEILHNYKLDNDQFLNTVCLIIIQFSAMHI